MPQMHESIFSYGLSRSYPFKWFTPTVILGAIVATALFSFLNVAATGYEMVTVEASSPNETTAMKTYFSGWPNFMTGNTRPSCDTKILGIRNAYTTSNAALSYTLDNIWQNKSDGAPEYFGDVPYYNNRLKACTVPSVEIFLESMGRSAWQISGQVWGAELKAEIVCTLDIPEGSKYVQLSTTYDFNTAASRFPGRNETTRPSLWWGESLLAWYYIKLTRDVAFLDNGKDVTLRKGYMKYRPPTTPVSSSDDIASPTFFTDLTPSCFFVSERNQLVPAPVIGYCNRTAAARPFDNASLWSSAVAITKVFHSTVLADLGQPESNILTDTNLLEYFSSNISEIARQQAGGQATWGWGNNLKVSEVGLAAGPYTVQNKTRWNLRAEPSFMSITYLCQVPRLKSAGSLILSVLIADFVLLQVLWKLFVLCVDFFMYRNYADMGSCQGCRKDSVVDRDGFELLHTESVASDLESSRIPR